jgi:tetratricopeptide (TPR) repeat protein
MLKLNLLLALLIFSAVASAQFFTSDTGKSVGEKLKQGDQAGALAILDNAIAKGKDLTDAYEMRANLRSMTGNLRGSVDDLSEAIKLKPDNPQLYKRRALFRSFLRDSDGALKDYDSAIANGLKSDEVYTGRARIKADIGDIDGAIVDYRNALAANPNYASAHLGLSRVYEKKGDIDGAILELQQFADAYELKRDDALPKTKMGSPAGDAVVIKREGREPDGSQVVMAGMPVMTTFKASNQQELDAAVRGREQTVNVSNVFFDLGRLYNQRGDTDRALLNIGKGLQMSPSSSSGRQLRGEIRMQRGDLAGAIEDYKAAVESPLVAPNVHANKCILLTLQNDDAAAEKEMQIYVQAFPDAKAYLEKRVAEAKKLRSHP